MHILSSWRQRRGAYAKCGTGGGRATALVGERARPPPRIKPYRAAQPLVANGLHPAAESNARPTL